MFGCLVQRADIRECTHECVDVLLVAGQALAEDAVWQLRTAKLRTQLNDPRAKSWESGSKVVLAGPARASRRI